MGKTNYFIGNQVLKKALTPLRMFKYLLKNTQFLQLFYEMPNNLESYQELSSYLNTDSNSK